MIIVVTKTLKKFMSTPSRSACRTEHPHDADDQGCQGIRRVHEAPIVDPEQNHDEEEADARGQRCILADTDAQALADHVHAGQHGLRPEVVRQLLGLGRSLSFPHQRWRIEIDDRSEAVDGLAEVPFHEPLGLGIDAGDDLAGESPVVLKCGLQEGEPSIEGLDAKPLGLGGLRELPRSSLAPCCPSSASQAIAWS